LDDKIFNPSNGFQFESPKPALPQDQRIPRNLRIFGDGRFVSPICPLIEGSSFDDALVKSLNFGISVIPAKAGILFFQILTNFLGSGASPGPDPGSTGVTPFTEHLLTISKKFLPPPHKKLDKYFQINYINQ
jgi:hypothetical protein